MVRTAQFAGILVLDIGRVLERIGRTAHAAARGRGFSLRDGHFGSVWLSSRQAAYASGFEAGLIKGSEESCKPAFSGL
jgi:hypothetical protein